MPKRPLTCPSSSPLPETLSPGPAVDRLADLGTDVRRRWSRLAESDEQQLRDRIALGEVLDEAWRLNNGSKAKFGKWLDSTGWGQSRRTGLYHRQLALHQEQVLQLFGTQGPNDAFNYKDAVDLVIRAPEHLDAVCAGAMTVAQAIKQKKLDAELAARVPKLTEVPATASGDSWRLQEGDCLDQLVTLPEETVDLVIWDPPYDGDFEAVEQVAKVLVPTLVPQGIVAVLTSQMAVPPLMEVLAPHLSYGWTYAVPFSGTRLSVIQGRKVRQTWKPVVAYSKGPWPSGRLELHDDLLAPVKKVNTRFRWEQNPAIAKGLVARLCPDGGVVLDPMAGTASTGVAALELGRRFIGIEADHERFVECVERLRSAGEEEVA